MSVTTFLVNEALWKEINLRVKSAKSVHAAVAYFTQAKLLPLKKGDRLVVNLSPQTLKAGSTDPSELEKLVRRGVRVFSRNNLHSKIIITDDGVIVGSANISKSSESTLDEAAIFTNDRSVIRRAKTFMDQLCSEPVTHHYLEQCKRLYQRPRFSGSTKIQARGTKRLRHAKLWLVNLETYDIPESEEERCEASARKAERLIRDKQHSMLENFHWPSKPKMADELEFGDWVIQAIRDGSQRISVYPPGRFLNMDSWDRGKGKKRFVFHLEVPRWGQRIPWSKFKRFLKSILKRALAMPRTMAVRDINAADRLLGLWSESGRFSGR